MYLNKYIKILAIAGYIILNIILLYFSLSNYKGQILWFITLLFVSNSYIYFSFNHSRLFLDKTLSVFLWLGFFYKLCVIIIFQTSFPEGGGAFSYSAYDFDRLLKYSSVGILGFLLASLAFNRILNFNDFFEKQEVSILLNFYEKNRKYLFLFFFVLIIIVGSTNLYLGFYQKGLLPRHDVNFILGAFLKWMLIFGLTSISCLLLEYELKVFKKLSAFVLLIFFFELAFTNLSLLSRSMIFGGSAIIFAIYSNYENKIIKNKLTNSLVLNTSILLVIFVLMIFPINKIRNSSYIDAMYFAKKTAKQMVMDSKEITEINKSNTNIKKTEIQNIEIKKIIDSNISDEKKIEIISEKIVNRDKQILDINENIERVIFVIKNRFVGLDGVAAVTSYPKLDYYLFKKALNEEFDPNLYGFYQRTFVIPFENNNETTYKKSSERHYGIIIPGILSFLSYPGSLIFLILSVILVHFFCSTIEHLSRRLTFNSSIFSSFIGFVLGYRLIHFGYLPKQSYLIISAIIITVLLVILVKITIIKNYKKNV